jgi:hypothetical protein
MKTYKTLEKALEAEKYESQSYKELQRINELLTKYNGGIKLLYLEKIGSRFYLGQEKDGEGLGYFFNTTNAKELYIKIYSFWDFAWLFRNKEIEGETAK